MNGIIWDMIYSIVPPLFFIIVIHKILFEYQYLDFIKDMDWTKPKMKSKKEESISRNINKYSAIFLISLLLTFLYGASLLQLY
ncbi:MAG: hypothetical protein R6W73_02605 [Candidatus Saliniplasma sp.]